ncbi:MAG: hypothetical protein PHD97_11640 [Bacteroidales bacterium]|nr:hypothetical protein [Bacteroidales bacterium]
MQQKKTKNKKTLAEKYPPSEPCSCEICMQYCKRPGWWTVAEASKAIDAGYGNRMMLEMSPDKTFGVLSPAFRGCEADFALNIHANKGCNFLKNNLCEIHGTGFQPLECRFCHHERRGQGLQCHLEIENEWKTKEGQHLIQKWGDVTGFWERLKI